MKYSYCEGCAAMHRCPSYVGYGSVMCTINQMQVKQSKADVLKQSACEEYNKAIQDFYREVLNFEGYIEPKEEHNGEPLYSSRDIMQMVDRVLDKLYKRAV
jgi:hypothetical protein